MEVLVLVDLQVDFLPGGALAVPDGDAVIPVANDLIAQFHHVVASQDWHPAEHASFASNHPGKSPGDVIDLDGVSQVLWPDHCVQDTPGAAFAPGLAVSGIDQIFHKGTNPRVDSYSAFFDNAARHPTGLSGHLEAILPERLVVMGLATDYCVLATVRDARRLGYATDVVLEGCRGIDAKPGDVDAALEEMRGLGARLRHVSEW